MNQEKLTDRMDRSWETSELTGLNSAYLEGLYEDYLDDPSKVDPKIRAYFDSAALMGNPALQEPKHSQIQERFRHLQSGLSVPVMGEKSGWDIRYLGISRLIEAYRSFGHTKAQLDPLGLWVRTAPQELQLETYGLSSADLRASFEANILGFGSGTLTLKQILESLEKTYCGSIGAEIMQVSTGQERQFLLSKFENRAAAQTPEAKRALLSDLIAADGLEKYLGMKYPGQKRFSLEGGDALIPLVKTMIDQASALGNQQVSIGMAHRGRLNILVNVLGKSPAELFSEFEGKYANKLVSGDVKYHNGFSSDLKTTTGVSHVVLAFNPSHLEVVAPVVEGSVRARQMKRSDNRNQVMSLHIHGDAAFAGQGVVMETLAMSQTRAYSTGGSIHVIVNNQVGFTTSRRDDARSSMYCTDPGKMTDCPIFHVNAEDPESVLWVAALAVEYRMKFHKDVIIDLVCYRLHGHNEADEPSATQPLMVQVIKQKKAPWQLYADGLMAQQVLKAQEAETLFQSYQDALAKGEPVANLAKDVVFKHGAAWADYLNQAWDQSYVEKTKLTQSALVATAQKLEALPEGFTVQRQVAKVLQDRVKMTQGELPINWGYAEVLAYATLLEQGALIRFTGEDVERGTFAHRHAVLNDQVTGETFTPLAQIGNGKLVIHNSLLSELAVVAFEYGFACANPKALVIWEAQFGDFVNMAQPIIDQFIASAEEKWGRLCGLMMLLPHGYEGMGAEHSSARLERFLQLCANENIQVCVPTTPAQIFHLIRRQLLRPYRKPLVVMSPKSLLRHPECVSSLEDLTTGEYQLVIPETDAEIQSNIGKVKRVVICQGKVYYDLLAARKELKRTDIALIRLEQLYPFPDKALAFALKPYAHVKDIVWCQEEPENQGAWRILQHNIQALLGASQRLSYAGRPAFASPASGYPSFHKEQQSALINQALSNQ